MQILLTLLIASVGAFIGLRLKIPGGAMVGGLVLVVICNLLWGFAYMPITVKTVIQISVGLSVGSKIYKEDVKRLGHVLLPAAITIFCMLFLCVLMGAALHVATGIPLATTMFCCAPGGLVDMTIISYDLGADSTVVAAMQTIRLVSIVLLFPVVVKAILPHLSPNMKTQTAAPVQKRDTTHFTPFNCALSFGVAICAGLLGYFSHIPAGALTFSICACAAMNVCSGRAYAPKWLPRCSQVLSGAFIASSVTQQTFQTLKQLLFPAVLLICGYMIISVLLALLLHKLSHLDLTTTFFSCTPGGATDVALMSIDYGADFPTVSVLQTFRMVCVIVFFPFIIEGLFMWFH